MQSDHFWSGKNFFFMQKEREASYMLPAATLIPFLALHHHPTLSLTTKMKERETQGSERDKRSSLCLSLSLLPKMRRKDLLPHLLFLSTNHSSRSKLVITILLLLLLHCLSSVTCCATLSLLLHAHTHVVLLPSPF